MAGFLKDDGSKKEALVWYPNLDVKINTEEITDSNQAFYVLPTNDNKFIVPSLPTPYDGSINNIRFLAETESHFAKNKEHMENPSFVNHLNNMNDVLFRTLVDRYDFVIRQNFLIIYLEGLNTYLSEYIKDQESVKHLILEYIFRRFKPYNNYCYGMDYNQILGITTDQATTFLIDLALNATSNAAFNYGNFVNELIEQDLIDYEKFANKFMESADPEIDMKKVTNNQKIAYTISALNEVANSDICKLGDIIEINTINMFSNYMSNRVDIPKVKDILDAKIPTVAQIPTSDNDDKYSFDV